MALADDVTNRVRSSTLKGLTNPNSNTASSVDTTYLGYAVTDTQALLEGYLGVSYSSSNAIHVALGVQGVLIRLKQWAGDGAYPKIDDEAKAWRDEAKAMAKTQGRARIEMKSSSEVTESDENTTDAEVRPDFDREIWDEHVPDQP